MSIPYIEVSGTNRQIGQAIGEHLRDDIAVALRNFEKNYSPTAALKKRRAKLLTTAKKYFPEYVEELQGMAEGSKQTFDRLVSYSFEEELAYLESCSTLAVNTGHTVLFGHNEDWDHPQPLYVVKAKPKKGAAFLGLAYAAQLPGTSATINDAGLVYAANSIATDILDTGLPKVYCLRSLASATSLDTALERITQINRSAGNTSVLVEKKSLYVVEWSPLAIGVETCEPWVAHANRYILPEMKIEQGAASRTSTSEGRLKQMWNWLVHNPTPSAHDLKALLSDHTDNPTSLCRHGKKDITIASIVIDTAARRMEVAYGNPCETPYQRFWL